MIKMTGAEWNRFYADESNWSDGTYHDDEEMLMDGEPIGSDSDLSALPAESAIQLKGGVVYLKADDREGPSLESFFKQWRKRQTTTIVVVECPKNLAGAVKQAVLTAGGKVISRGATDE